MDRERNKVAEFYKAKIEEVLNSLLLLEDEITALEERDLGADDVIKEEDEEDGDGVGMEDGEERGEQDALLSPATTVPPRTSNTNPNTRRTFMNRFAPALGRRRKSALTNPHEADILEATVAPSSKRARSRSTQRGLEESVSDGYFADADAIPSPRILPPKSSRGRRSFDLESSEDGGVPHDRRTSTSSNSSRGEFDLSWPRRQTNSLGLVQMDPASVPVFAADQSGLVGERERRKAVYLWTANNDYGTVLRIGFKKRISAVWLEGYALKQYVDLNLTAFEKILKK